MNRIEYLKKSREDNKEHIRQYKKEYAKTHDNSFKKLQDKYKKLQQENQELKKQLEERKYYKFYKYENNPNGSDYCYCQRPCDSNMSLKCFFENGEICGFMSETLVSKYDDIKEISFEEFAHDFIKPLINISFQNNKLHYYKTLYQSLKRQKEEMRKYFNARIEVCDNRLSSPFCDFEKATKERLIFSQCLEKLEELEGVSNVKN